MSQYQFKHSRIKLSMVQTICEYSADCIRSRYVINDNKKYT